MIVCAGWVSAQQMMVTPRSWSKFAVGMGLASALVGRLAEPRELVSTKPGDHGFNEILSALWTHVAKPVLDALAFSVGHGISE
jgi:hypothetical protein